MGNIMSGRGGGGVKLFAVISVTYPAGSVCTCTKGTKNYKAKNTSGLALFAVPEVGTWTVSCTDGTDTASKTVTISAEGETSHVQLTYGYLFKAGAGAIVQFDTAHETDASVSIANDAIKITYTATANPRVLCITHDSINLTGINTLTCQANVSNVLEAGGLYGGILAVFAPTATAANMLDPDNNDSRILARQSFSVKNGVFVLDTSAITGNHKIGIKGGLKASITEIRLT
nr:MAG TPA: hypothetical protein [Caudoviricetes sp.]